MPETKEDNIIYIGKQPAMVYATSVMVQAQEGQKLIIIKARGKSISRAVDVSQLALRKFVKDFKIGTITVGTEERDYVPDERDKRPKVEGPRKVLVSTIEIPLIKQ